MANIDIPKESKAYRVYQRLKEAGETDSSLDQGYHEIDYSKPGPNEKLVGKGDGNITPPEIYERALDLFERSPQNEKYRRIVEEFAGSPIPWLLDDFDPSTSFDASIRTKTSEAISKVRQVLESLNIKPEKDPYNYHEKMAVSLYYFVYFPQDQGSLRENRADLLEGASDLATMGLGRFRDWLFEKGGLGLGYVTEDSLVEAPALKALQDRKGWCTEKSKVLYAVYRMAGLKPVFVFTTLSEMGEKLKERGAKEIPQSYRTQGHIYLGVPLTNHEWRYFDLAMQDTHAQYANFYHLRLSHYLASDKSNYGVSLFQQQDLEKALEILKEASSIDPKQSTPWNNLCFLHVSKGELEAALDDCKKATQLMPRFAPSQVNLGGVLTAMKRFGEAERYYREAIRLDPELAMGHMGLAIALSIQKKKDDLITATKDFVRHHPSDPMANGFLLAALLVSQRFAEMVDVFSSLSRFTSLSDLLNSTTAAPFLTMMTKAIEAGPNGKGIIAQFEQDTGGGDAAKVMLSLTVSFALWKSGEKKQAEKIFTDIIRALDFSQPPQESTKDFLRKILLVMPHAMKEGSPCGALLESYKKKWNI